MGPPSDPGKEMALREALEVIARDLRDAALVHRAICDQSVRHQRAKQRGGKWVDLVVVRGHAPDARLIKDVAWVTCTYGNDRRA